MWSKLLIIFTVSLIWWFGSTDSSVGQEPSCDLHNGTGDNIRDLIECINEETELPLVVPIPQPRPEGLGRFRDPFYNENGCWSTSRPRADRCTHPSWLEMSMIDRAQHIHDSYVELLEAHDLDYSPRILTCKAVRESCLRPQDQSPASNSTASGLSQVTRSTARDLFNRGSWFQPKVYGFTSINDGRTYHDEMKHSILAQMELGLAVLHQKSIDTGSSNIRTLLQNYLGTGSASANQEYANKIYDCAECIVNNGNRLSESCLRQARESCF